MLEVVLWQAPISQKMGREKARRKAQMQSCSSVQVIVSFVLSKETLEWHVSTESMNNAVALNTLLGTMKLKSQFI